MENLFKMKFLMTIGLVGLFGCIPASAGGFVVSRYCTVVEQLDGGAINGISPVSNFANTEDCAYALGVAATGNGYYSTTAVATSGIVRASAEVGNTFDAFGSTGLVTSSLPGNRSSATGVSSFAFMDDIVTVQGLTVPYLDAVFAVRLDGYYGAHAGDSGGGSILGSSFNAIGSLENRTSQRTTGFNVVGCATDKATFSDHGSQCNGALDFAGGGEASNTYLLSMRIANDEELRIQLTMITSSGAAIDNVADPLAFSGSIFGHSLDWAGLVSAVDPDGNAYTGPVSALAANGFDYAGTAAPEPATFLLAGLVLAGAAVRRYL